MEKRSMDGIKDCAERQIELHSEASEIEEKWGKEIYQRTNPLIIIWDETIGGHEYNELKRERERQGKVGRDPEVKQVAKINDTTREALPTERLNDQKEAWDDIVQRETGAWSINPITYRKDVYIKGTPGFVVFQNGRPVDLLRLRGTRYYDRNQPYPSQLVGPWVTCRILDREGFNVENLSFTLLRYDRQGIDVDSAALLVRIKHLLLTDQQGKNRISIDRAVNGLIESESSLSDFSLDTYNYEKRFRHEDVDFFTRLRRSLKLVKGECEPKETPLS